MCAPVAFTTNGVSQKEEYACTDGAQHRLRREAPDFWFHKINRFPVRLTFTEICAKQPKRPQLHANY